MPELELCPAQARGLRWSGYAIVHVGTSGTDVNVRCLRAVIAGEDVTDRVHGVQLHADCFTAQPPFRIPFDDGSFRLLVPCAWVDRSRSSSEATSDSQRSDSPNSPSSQLSDAQSL